MESIMMVIGVATCFFILSLCIIGAISAICHDTNIEELKERIKKLETKE